MERLYVLPQDVCNITGKKLRYAQNLLKDLKILLKKEKHQFISKKELATFFNIDEGLIILDEADQVQFRIFVHASDVRRITGKHPRTVQEILQTLHLVLNKEKHQFITKNELADYLGLERDSIILDEMGWRTSKS